MATSCAMARWGDCSPEVPPAFCESLDVVLCSKHHTETHSGNSYAVDDQTRSYHCRKKRRVVE